MSGSSIPSEEAFGVPGITQGPPPEPEGPAELTQTDNRPNTLDPDIELPQDADFDPASDPEAVLEPEG